MQEKKTLVFCLRIVSMTVISLCSFLLLIFACALAMGMPTAGLEAPESSVLSRQQAVHSLELRDRGGQEEVFTRETSAPQLLPVEGTADWLATAEPVYDSLTIAQRLAADKTLVLPPPSKPEAGEKIVYLTFDDGPDLNNTPAVLAILAQNGIKATFFVVGAKIEAQPELLRSIYQAGHAIGNHSYNHDYRQLYRNSAAYLNQLQKTEEIMQQILGVRTLISRAPGGSAGNFSKQYWEALCSVGYREVGWNISSCDASSAKAAELVENIKWQMEIKGNPCQAVVLMHDGAGHRETVLALPGIIQYYQQQGFKFSVINPYTPTVW